MSGQYMIDDWCRSGVYNIQTV